MRQFLAPLLSIFIFVLGNGFFPTLLALKLNLTDASDVIIGAMTALNYLGLLSGAFCIERLLCRIGHVRAYAIFASLLSVMMILTGLLSSIIILLLLRFLSGFATAGIYVIIESWLLEGASLAMRGKVLALYMIAFYLAHASGHFLLNIAQADDLLMFAIVSISCSLSVIPLGLTKAEIKKPETLATMRFMTLFRREPAGMMACFTTGLLSGAIYGLGPIFFSDIYHSKADVALFMSSFIFGGMLLQYPVGKWSDLRARREVLKSLNIAIIVILCLTKLGHQHYGLFMAQMGLLGGLILTMYPTSINASCDAVKKEEIIQATQSLLIIYSIGAIFGPLLASLFMYEMGPWGLFVFLCATSCFLLPYLVIPAHRESLNTNQAESKEGRRSLEFESP